MRCVLRQWSPRLFDKYIMSIEKGCLIGFLLVVYRTGECSQVSITRSVLLKLYRIIRLLRQHASAGQRRGLYVIRSTSFDLVLFLRCGLIFFFFFICPSRPNHSHFYRVTCSCFSPFRVSISVFAFRFRFQSRVRVQVKLADRVRTLLRERRNDVSEKERAAAVWTSTTWWCGMEL